MNKRNRLAFICTIAAVCTLFTTSAWAASANDKKTTVRQPVKTVQAKSSSASKKTTTAAKPVEESTDTVRIGIREGQGRIFAEDREMLERQQLNLQQHPERRLLMLNIDAGGVQSRKIIERLIDEEKNESGVAALA